MKFLSALFSLFATTISPGVAGIVHADETAILPLIRAHAHNDYEHERPLLDAVDRGFCSVEADVFAVKGELLVAHNFLDLKPERNLKSLYLQPLREIVGRNAGSVYGHDVTFTLLIDFKSEADATFDLLEKTLKEFQELLVPVPPAKHAAVQVVVSGNRPFERIRDMKPQLCGLDGRLTDLDTKLSSSTMPLISDNWRNHFTWRGDGPMPMDEKAKLADIVAKAHSAGRRVRFWATPEVESLWHELLEARVDHINTDRLDALRAFLEQHSE